MNPLPQFSSVTYVTFTTSISFSVGSLYVS